MMIHLKAILLGLALAAPPVASWVVRGDVNPPDTAAVVRVSSMPEAIPDAKPAKIPVEVVSNGSEPQLIFVETPAQSIPEPGVLPLATLAAALLLRRKRPGTRN
jgi:MYXO-CTERM domain-containing protein